MKKCPYCAESIQDEAVVCRYCGRDQPPGRPDSTGPSLLQGSGIDVGSSAPLMPAAIVVGGALVVLGSFLPWATIRAPLVGTLNKSGMEGGDGIISLILGLALIGAGYQALRTRGGSRGLKFAVLLGAAGVIALAVFEYNDVKQKIDATTSGSPYISGSAGAGLWTLFVGAGLATIAALALMQRSGVRRAPAMIPPDPSVTGLPRLPGVAITHVGESYFLGGILAKKQYGIWEKGNAEPLELFPFGDRGWQEAYQTFSKLDPKHETAR